MKLVIIFFLSFSILAVYCQAEKARKIEGQIIIYVVDEKGNKSLPEEEKWPNFCVDLYYQNETGKEFPCKCTDSPNISDKLRFVVTISGKCSSPEFYEKGKKLYLKPNFGSPYPPAGWVVEEPPPHIILDENQGNEPYPPNKNLVILMPIKPITKDRQANLETAKEVFKESPEKSLIYFWEAARGEGNEQEFAKKAVDFLRENDQEFYANRLFRNQYIKKIESPESFERSGDIFGSVVLADGSKIPGAIVTITGNQTKKATISSANGDFRFSSLPPGEYTIKVEFEGFKTVIHEGVQVGLGKTVTLNILMDTNTLEEKTNIID
ncbi:carboxypeptidase-like regulatory domain-containing protein [Acidobacteriota bacterium]